MIEMPSIVKLRETYRAKGFEVVAINLDEKPTAALPQTMKKLGIDFTVYLDHDQKLADLFRVEAIPLTVILDKDRKVLMIENGEKDWDGAEFRAQLEKWLSF